MVRSLDIYILIHDIQLTLQKIIASIVYENVCILGFSAGAIGAIGVGILVVTSLLTFAIYLAVMWYRSGRFSHTVLDFWGLRNGNDDNKSTSSTSKLEKDSVEV